MDYKAIIEGDDFKAIRDLFVRPSFEIEQEEAIREYKISEHNVFNESKRPDKTVYVDTIPEDGRASSTIVKKVPVARIGTPFQFLIVDRRVGFSLTIPVKTEIKYTKGKENDAEKNVSDIVDLVLDENKMDYKNKEILRRRMSEMECAEFWYFVKSDYDEIKFMPRCAIWSPDLGDRLYPLFDNLGDMIAFARSYKLSDTGKEIEHFDVYTDEYSYMYINDGKNWVLDPDYSATNVSTGETKIMNPVPNIIGKIVIIYHYQKEPECHKVQSMCERWESLTSNWSDMNDYFGSPILTIVGEILGFVQKGEQGKIMQLSKDAKADYLALNSTPESIKDELANLKQMIYTMSQTPDISFESMKGIGTIAQFTMKAFFMDAHMAVSRVEETFGISLQRRLNLLKAMIGKTNPTLQAPAKSLRLKPIITPYLPQNISELIENLSVLKTSKGVSSETIVENNPYVSNKEEEMNRIKQDTDAENTVDLQN